MNDDEKGYVAQEVVGEFRPDLWTPLEMAGGDGTRFVFLDENAKVSYGGTSCEIQIDRFSLCHANDQMLDNGKVLLILGEELSLLDDAVLVVDANIAAEGHGTYSGHFSHGVVSLTLFDPTSGFVFDWFVTPTAAIPLHERLPVDGVTSEEAFSNLIVDPFAEPLVPSEAHRYQVRVDPVRRIARWSMNDHARYEVPLGPVVPTSLSVGLGIFTLIPVGNGRSNCILGQGMTGRWSELAITRYVRAEHG